MCKENLKIDASGIDFDSELDIEQYIREKTIELAMSKIDKIVAANTSGQSISEITYFDLAVARRLMQRVENHTLMDTLVELHPFQKC